MISEIYKLYLQNPSIATDTRKIKSGDIFFALKGPNFNGNDFLQAALNSGAAYCIADEDRLDNSRIIRVNDALIALQALAKEHRSQLNIPFIGITGTNGKTTTKELMHAVLNSTFKTYTTEGNLNNHIGVPLTILKIKDDAQMAVIEMGANHIGEIAGYCEIARPTHGLITNCGKAHLEGFGSEEGVRIAKGELYNFLRKTHGTAFINADLPYLTDMSSGIENRFYYGTQTPYSGSAKNNALLQIVLEDGTEIDSNLIGDYNLPNVLAAIAIGDYFGVERAKSISAIENYIPANSRSQLLEWNGNQVILDAYNANPSSMKVAIENFAAMQFPSKILILGSMKELGTQSNSEHDTLTRLIEQHSWKQIILVGDEFKKIPETAKHFKTSEEAASWFKDQQYTGSYILIKGSRSTQMEKILKS